MPTSMVHAGVVFGTILTVVGVVLAIFGVWSVIPGQKFLFLSTIIFGLLFVASALGWYFLSPQIQK